MPLAQFLKTSYTTTAKNFIDFMITFYEMDPAFVSFVDEILVVQGRTGLHFCTHVQANNLLWTVDGQSLYAGIESLQGPDWIPVGSIDLSFGQHEATMQFDDRSIRVFTVSSQFEDPYMEFKDAFLLFAGSELTYAILDTGSPCSFHSPDITALLKERGLAKKVCSRYIKIKGFPRLS